MVAFGKKLRETQIQEWQGYYINYKLMKKKVNRYSQQIQVGPHDQSHVLIDFSRMLDIQIEKIVMFLLEQQGSLARRLSELRERNACDGKEEVSELEEAYRAIGRDLLRLLFFVEMNAIGLRKILKKFDKRFGYKFTDYYVKTRSNHPYSQLRQVFKQVGVGAVVGAISRNLVELRDIKENRENYVSIYDQPNFSDPDPIANSINKAFERLSNSTNFLDFVGRHALIFPEELPTQSSSSEDNVDNDDQRYHFISLVLNLANTFLYMVNTYIIVPSADHYSITLGAAATVCGAVIGSMAVAQVFSSVYFSAWSNKSYLRPLVFSSIILFVGNTLYALAYDLNSIAVLLVGRLFCGLGSARAINRRYISDCVPLKLRMQASAGFVSAGALGMACGPAMACLFRANFKIYGLTFNEDTLPGWVMAFTWLVYLLWLSICFREPRFATQKGLISHDSISGKYPPMKHTRTGNKEVGQLINVAVENSSSQPLLMKCDENDQDCNDVEEDSDEIQKPVDSIVSAYKLLTPSIKVQLFVYFMLKYAMEILLAESSVVTGYYFVWSTRSVAIFLACLGLTVLPVNIIVGNYISNMFEERQVLLASEIMVCLGLMLSFHILVPYSVPQYVCSALITFVSAEVLEGVNLSLLSRVMSSRLSRGTYNGGLLSTEAGTLARVVADGTIALSGYLGENMVLNTTLVPALFICVSSIIATCFTYNSLY